MKADLASINSPEGVEGSDKQTSAKTGLDKASLPRLSTFALARIEWWEVVSYHIRNDWLAIGQQGQSTIVSTPFPNSKPPTRMKYDAVLFCWEALRVAGGQRCFRFTAHTSSRHTRSLGPGPHEAGKKKLRTSFEILCCRETFRPETCPDSS